MKTRPRLLARALLASTLLLAAPASGATPHDVLSAYRLTAWGSTEGLSSGSVWAIAQDPAGYLWLGTDMGLVRFDGVRFSRWTSFGTTQLPRVSVRTLCFAGDGSMWVGFGSLQGASRVQGGKVRNFSAQDGLPATDVTSIVEDASSQIWAGGSAGLFSYNGTRWESWPPERGLPSGPIYTVAVDRTGGLLVGMQNGVFRKRVGQDEFEQVGILGSQVSIADFSRLFGGDIVRAVLEDQDGAVWVTDPIDGFRGIEPWQRSTEKGRGAALLSDSRGNVWVGTWAQGLWLVTRDPAGGRLSVNRVSGLSDIAGNQVRSLREDREGNIWAGTLDGLYRLSPSKVESNTNIGLLGGIGATPDGSVWLSSGDDLLQVSGGRIRKHDELRRFTRALYRTLDIDGGTVWTSTRSELFRVTTSRSEAIPLTGAGPLQSINTIVADRQGGVFLNDLDRGLMRWRRGRVEAIPLPAELGRMRIEALYMDRSLRLWISFSDGRLATLDRADHVQVHTLERGAGVYRPMFQDSKGFMWLGGSEGVTRFDGTRFATWRGTESLPAESILNIVEDQNGTLWLGTPSGVMRMTREDFESASEDPAAPLRHGFYDSSDGITGTPRWFGKQSAVRGPDGRLWFLTSRGISILDPLALPERVPSAPVQVEAVIANGESQEPVSGMALPSRTERLEFEYSVPTLTSPAKTRFRYRLEGFDTDWVLAGTRRQAFYTGVPPGQYRFQVMAGNSQGDWGVPAAEMMIVVKPAFYRTSWFYATAVLAIIGIVATTWRLHLIRVRRQFSFVLGERLRLSREIHDTLLQSLVGVALQCEALADEIGHDSPARDQFRRLRREVQDHIRDARQVIWNLRSPIVDENDLVARLQRVGNQAVAGTPISFTLHVDGAQKPCTDDVREQLLRIGQEAILNAVRHAHATQIDMQLEYQDTTISLRVTDDGRGFSFDEVAFDAGRHYGLLSMRERAETSGGRFRVTIRAGQGTTVEAVVAVDAAPEGAYANA
jgi:signal transduction histidine kinase/ligand-binding sensor domain-containing protein